MNDQNLSPEEIEALLSCALNKTKRARPWMDTDLQVAGKLIGKRFMQTVKPGMADAVEFLGEVIPILNRGDSVMLTPEGYHAIVALSVADLSAGGVFPRVGDLEKAQTLARAFLSTLPSPRQDTLSGLVPTSNHDRQLAVSAAADQFARSGIFADYQARRAANTLRRQLDDLGTFAEYLTAVRFYGRSGADAGQLYQDAEAWKYISYGVITGFVRWMLAHEYAVGTVNLKLSTVKQYAKLAFQAKVIDAEQHALIRTVSGFQFKEHKQVNEKRSAAGVATRKGVKKAETVSLDKTQVRTLKTQPDTPQGRRDALLLCLLLDHGLRVGELAALGVTAFDLAAGLMIFDRPKVGKVQTHELTRDTLKAARAWFASGDAPTTGKLLRGSRKGGKLTEVGMSERAITARVRDLGEAMGIYGLSAHDLRHSWATRAARNKTDAFDLRDAGGWNSLAMPSRYVEAAKIANEGVNLGED